jgi:hypothetical protein
MRVPVDEKNPIIHSVPNLNKYQLLYAVPGSRELNDGRQADRLERQKQYVPQCS